MRAPSAFALLLVSLGAIFSADASTLDQNFNPPFFAAPDFSSRVLLLPDGKYVTYFNDDTLADQPAGAITRYFANGTLDTSFNFTRDYSFVNAAASVAGGKLIIAAQQYTYGSGVNDLSHSVFQILRLNQDGSIDSSFSPNPRTTDGGEVRAIAIQPDGKILIAGRFTAFNGTPRQGIVRLNSDGTLDINFATITLTGTHPFDSVLQIIGLWAVPTVQTDINGDVTGIFITGDFEGVSDGTNSIACPGIARLNADGTVDTTFQPSGFQGYFGGGGGRLRPVRGAVIQSDGKIVIGGRFSVPATFASNPTSATYDRLPLIRLNSDGSADESYGYFGSMDTADSTFIQIRAIVIQPDDKVIAVDNSVFRFNANSNGPLTPGALDPTFRQPDLLVDRAPADNFTLPESFTLNLRPDGRVLIGGTFSDVDDAPPLAANGERWTVAQFNSNGTLDTGFHTTHRPAANAYPTSFLRGTDGLTLIAFNQTGFSSGKGPIPNNFGRLLFDGSFDANFNPLESLPDGAVRGRGFAVLPDGNILGFGYRKQTGDFSYGLLKPDGTLADQSYSDDHNISFDAAYPQPQTNNQVLISELGNAQNLTDNALLSNTAQHVVDNTELQRLNSDGSLDPSFVLDSSIATNAVQRVSGNLQTVAADSKVLAVFGDGSILFTYLATDNTYRLVRLLSDGSLDSGFQEGSVSANTTSRLQLVFDPQASGEVNVTVLSPSGGVPGFSDAQLVAGNKIVVVGQFTTYLNSTGHPANGIIRLNSDGTVDSAFNPGNGAEWTQTVETASFHPAIDNIEMESDGQLLITGTFESFDGVSAPGIALLNSDGSVNASFAAPATRQTFDYHPAYLARQPDDSFLLSGPYSFPNQTQSPSFIHIFGVPKITSPLTATATVGQLFVYQVTASNEPESYGATPIPANLSFDNVLGIIGGVPTIPGIVEVQVSATNSTGTGSATLTITVQPAPSSGPVIVSGTSVTARTGRPFSFRILTENATSAARLDASGLPPGLDADPVTGIISGTPTSDGGFGVTLTVTDGPNTTQGILQITCVSDPAFPVITSPSGAFLIPGQFFSYTITTPGDPDPSDPTSYSIIGALPPGLGFNPQTHTISGIYTPGPNKVSNRAQTGTNAASVDEGGPRSDGAMPQLNETPQVGITGLVTHNNNGTATQPLNYFPPTSTPVIMLGVSSSSINEGGSATFTFSTSIVDPVNSKSVLYKMSGKAKSGSDYTLSGSSVIPAGASTATVTLTALTDAVPKEKNETVTLTLSKVQKKGGPYILSSAKKVTVTIVNVP